MAIKGIDIYSDTIITDWNAIKGDGVQAIYIKATEGKTYVNPLMDSQYKNAKAQGINVGFYHFARKNDPIQEYNYFMNTILKYQQDLKPVLDYEVSNPDISFIEQFMAQNSNLLLYASHSVADNSGIPKNKIWIAEPNTRPLDTNGYAGIQYTWNGRVPGIQGNSDINLFSRDVFLDSNNAVVNESSQIIQSYDDTVRIIQLQLNTLLKKGLAVDGIKGPATISAIQEFQRIMGLTQDGIWGPNTAVAVEEIYSRPEDGVPYKHYEYATRYIQFRVGASVNGIFENKTKVNVQNWQASHDLVADGIVGPVTWAKLLDENV